MTLTLTVQEPPFPLVKTGMTEWHLWGQGPALAGGLSPPPPTLSKGSCPGGLSAHPAPCHIGLKLECVCLDSSPVGSLPQACLHSWLSLHTSVPCSCRCYPIPCLEPLPTSACFTGAQATPAPRLGRQHFRSSSASFAVTQGMCSTGPAHRRRPRN